MAIAAALIALVLAAQEPPRLPAAIPGTSIVLPHRLLAGERATLAVLGPGGRLAPGAVVEFTGGERVTTDPSGRASFVAPLQEGVLFARLVEHGARASTTVLGSLPVASQGESNTVRVTSFPRVLSLSDRFNVEGIGFRGEADANQVTLGGQPALVLAASPVSLVVLPGPRLHEGPAGLEIAAGGERAGVFPLTLVSLDIHSSKKQLAQGEKGRLTVRVRGTDERLVVEVHNLTPEVIELPRGNVQRITTRGGVINAAEIEVAGLRVGEFSVSARLVPGAVGLPDLEAVRRQLLAAREQSPPEWQERLDRVIHRIEHDPQDVSRIRDELEKMLSDQPPGGLGRLIEAAWRELLKR